MDYNEKLYNVFSNKEHRLESWMAAVFSKEYDHNVTIDELKDILAEENGFIVTELKEVEKENYIRENSKWEVILKAEYIEDYECDDCSAVVIAIIKNATTIALAKEMNALALINTAKNINALVQTITKKTVNAAAVMIT